MIEHSHNIGEVRGKLFAGSYSPGEAGSDEGC
jgi:hypothetical protein